MSKRKRWLGIAAVLLICGLAIIAAALLVYDGDIAALNSAKYEANTYPVSESFHHISIDADAENIIFVPGERGKCEVICYEDAKISHTVMVRDDTLVIGTHDERGLLDYTGIWTEATSITICLPEEEYGRLHIDADTGDITIPAEFRFESLQIETDTGDVENFAAVYGRMEIDTNTGDIRMENLAASSLELSTSTGDVFLSGVDCEENMEIETSTGRVELSDLRCRNFMSEGNTGMLSLTRVIVEERFSAVRTTGDVKFADSDAAEIFIKTDTGDVSGNLLSDKIFFVTTDTGDVEVPQTTTGGRCEIITDAGDVRLEIR